MKEFARARKAIASRVSGQREAGPIGAGPLGPVFLSDFRYVPASTSKPLRSASCPFSRITTS
jgi:hypothetical protein